MIHPIYRVTLCEVLAPYSLRLTFDDGLSRTIDLEAILEGEVYGKLRDPFLFSQVSIDPEIGTITWASGADFDPAILHDWPSHCDSFTAAAQRWKQIMQEA